MSNINPKPGLCSFDLSTLVISDEKVRKTWQRVWKEVGIWQKQKAPNLFSLNLRLIIQIRCFCVNHLHFFRNVGLLTGIVFFQWIPFGFHFLLTRCVNWRADFLCRFSANQLHLHHCLRKLTIIVDVGLRNTSFYRIFSFRLLCWCTHYFHNVLSAERNQLVFFLQNPVLFPHSLNFSSTYVSFTF